MLAQTAPIIPGPSLNRITPTLQAQHVLRDTPIPPTTTNYFPTAPPSETPTNNLRSSHPPPPPPASPRHPTTLHVSSSCASNLEVRSWCPSHLIHQPALPCKTLIVPPPRKIIAGSPFQSLSAYHNRTHILRIPSPAHPRPVHRPNRRHPHSQRPCTPSQQPPEPLHLTQARHSRARRFISPRPHFLASGACAQGIYSPINPLGRTELW